MGLSVYLQTTTPVAVEPGSGIFVRQNGSIVEITRDEWDARNPGREPVVYASEIDECTECYSANITHNLGRMAGEAELYDALWRPDENGILVAEQLTPLLTKGLAKLLANPDKYRAFNPENGWGSYEGLVAFVENYLRACADFPEAKVMVSR